MVKVTSLHLCRQYMPVKQALMGKNNNESIVYFQQGYLDLNGGLFQGYLKVCKNHYISFMVDLWPWRSPMNVASFENTFITDVPFPCISAESPSPFYTFKKMTETWSPSAICLNTGSSFCIPLLPFILATGVVFQGV